MIPMRIAKGLKVSSLMIQFSRSSTIFALSSGTSRCAVAVIRVSGSNSETILKSLGNFKLMPEPRLATLRKLYDPTTKLLLDQGIVIWFPGPKSFTGEDSCEFHVHGGPAVISGILRSIGNIKGCRMAEPGEFTRRAFLNGKIDLTKIEGLGDLIEAETEKQRVQALNQMGGSLIRIYEPWRDRIAKCLANVEAFIDFSENDNIESDILVNVESNVKMLMTEINIHLHDQRKGELLRNGVKIGIIGEPNSGKSSLLNYLCQREAAIVSEIPGTTRDLIETTVNLNGYPIVFSDTAGIRNDPQDSIEKEGIRRAVKTAQESNIVIILIDISKYENLLPSGKNKHNGNVILQELISAFNINCSNDQHKSNEPNLNSVFNLNKTIIVLNKIDLINKADLSKFDNLTKHAISCKTHDGMNEFIKELTSKVSSLCANPESELPSLTHERYRNYLQNCVECLEEYLEESTSDLALKAHSLRNAMNSIGYITGHYGAEDILDIIFRDFCIGK